MQRPAKIGNVEGVKIEKFSDEEPIAEYRVKLDGLSASDQTHRRLKVRFGVE